MNKPTSPSRARCAILPLGLIALLATQCSTNGQAPTSDAQGVNVNYDPSNAASSGHTGSGDDAPATGDGNSSVTPAEERRRTTAEMRALRATLVAQLEQVRSRLNKGSDPTHEADQVRAGELAQGLERIDRALLVMDAATETTWGSIREIQLKEVQDVREWLKDRSADDATSMN